MTMPDFTYAAIAKILDHSLLQQTLTDAELEAGCQVARAYDVASVCIKPYAVPVAARILAGSTVAVGTTIGFPHGGQRTAIKVAEAQQTMDDGATELDMVVNIGKVLSMDWRFVADDIAAVVEAAHRRGALVKVIFENCFLADEHQEQLCRICGEGRLRQDVHRLRRRRRHRRRLAPDATLLAAARPGQGGRRGPHAR